MISAAMLLGMCQLAGGCERDSVCRLCASLHLSVEACPFPGENRESLNLGSLIDQLRR